MTALPASRLSRAWGAARATAAIGLGSLGAKNSIASAAATLGRLRGVAAKAGQMISYVDGVVPEKHRDAFTTALSTLQNATRTTAPDAVMNTLRSELGARLDDIAHIEPMPMASASIGQVHRGVLRDGTTVAIKVQHPGIEQAVEADLSNASMLESVMRTMGGGELETGRLLRELGDRFREELDYELEARRTQAFRELHRGDASIIVPRVFESLSTKRVLVSELITGDSFETACNAPSAERDAWAATMWRFVHRGILVGGLFNADPHPGNYIFKRDGTVGFLDFGCVQQIPDERRRTALRMHEAAGQNRRAAMREAARQLLQTNGGYYERRALTYIEMAMQPLTRSPYRISREYVAELVRDAQTMVADLRRRDFDGYVPMPPGTLFMNRLQFGFYSVLARLDATVDYASVERQFLHEAEGGP